MKKYNKEIDKLFKRASELAIKYQRNSICPEILFASFFPVYNLSLSMIFDNLSLSEEELEYYSLNIVENLRKNKNVSSRFSPKVREIIKEAEEVAEATDDELLPHHILVCMSSHLPKALIDMGVTEEELVDAYVSFEKGGESLEENGLETQQKQSLPMFEKNPILDQFAENLNIKALRGEFEDILDINNKIPEIITILSKEQKPNPILVGPAGTGKTSLVQGLANNIVKQNVPDLLANMVIYSVSLSSMLAGTEFRGQFEKRVQDFVNEAKRYNNVILFIDEIHTLVGAGNTSEGSLDASNMLKPDLARGNLKCIGATTIREYNKTIKKDSALDRRFERVTIKEPTHSQMKEMLPIIVGHYANKHGVIYSNEFVDSVLNTCDRLLPNKRYPDKAVDLIDFCGASVKVKYFNISDEINKKKDELFADSRNLSDIEKIKSFCNFVGDLKEQLAEKPPTVEQGEIKLFFKKYENPAYEICFNEEAKNFLKDEIIGQEEAVNKYIDGLYSGFYGTNANIVEKRPLSFLLYGPSQFNLSLFFDKLSNILKQNSTNVIRISGNELSEYSSSEAIVSPTRDESSLAERILADPVSVIFVDNFDKCNTLVKDLFRQILSEGQLSVGNGEVADFSNCHVILSCSSEEVKKQLGFSNSQKDDETKPIFDVKNVTYRISLGKLNLQSSFKIIKDKVDKIKNNLVNSGINLSFEEDDIKRLAEDLYNNKEQEKYLDNLFTDNISKFLVEEIRKNKKEINLKKLIKNPLK